MCFKLHLGINNFKRAEYISVQGDTMGAIKADLQYLVSSVVLEYILI